MSNEQESAEGPHLAVICEEHGVIAAVAEPELDRDGLATMGKIHLVFHRLKRPVRGSRCELTYGEVEHAA